MKKHTPGRIATCCSGSLSWDVNNNTGSEFDLRAGIDYPQLGFTLTLLEAHYLSFLFLSPANMHSQVNAAQINIVGRYGK